MFDIVMDKEAWDWWDAVQSSVDTEIAAFGYCKNDRRGELFVDTLFLVPQIVERSGVDFFSEGLPYAVNKAMEDDRLEDLRFCVHSHCDFTVHWSNTDEDMIAKMGSTGTPWFASLVTNWKGERKVRLDLWDPHLNGLGHLKLTDDKGIGFEVERLEFEGLDEHIAEFCKKPKPKPTVKNQTSGASAKSKYGTGRVTEADHDTIADKTRGKDVSDSAMFLDHEDALDLSERLDWYGIAFDGFIYWFQKMQRGNDVMVAQSLAPDDLDTPDGEVVDLDDDLLHQQVAI